MKYCFVILVCFILYSCSIFSKNKHVIPLSQIKQTEYDSSFIEAQKQKVLGNINISNNLLYKCLEIKPKSASVYYLLSINYWESQKRTSALACARSAVNLDPDNEWYLLQLAKFYQLSEKKDSAIYFYKKLVAINSNSFENRFNLAILYVENREILKSLKILNNIENDFGKSIDIFFVKYNVLYSLRKYNECTKLLKEAILKYPDETKFYGLLADFYISIGQKDSAFVYLKKQIIIAPENEDAFISLINFYKDIGNFVEANSLAKSFIADVSFSKKKKFEIINSYLNDKANFNKNKFDLKLLLDSLIVKDSSDIYSFKLLADYYLRTNEPDSAFQNLKYTLSLSNKNGLIWEEILFVLNAMNLPDSVNTYSDKAISLFIEPVFYLYKGVSLFQLKRYSDAINTLKTGLNLASGNKEMEIKFCSYLGENYYTIMDYSNSDKYFELVLSLDPYNIMVLNNYSYYLAIRNEKLDKALEYIERCIKIVPKSDTYLDSYGWILFKTGKVKDAKKIIEKSLFYGGYTNVTILEHYCEILISLQRRDEALKYYKMIKNLGSDSLRLKNLLNI